MANIPQPPVVQGLGGCRAKHSRTSHNETLFPLTSTLENCTLTQLSLNTAAKGEGNREKTVRHEQKREVFSLHFKPRQAGKENSAVLLQGVEQVYAGRCTLYAPVRRVTCSSRHCSALMKSICLVPQRSSCPMTWDSWALIVQKSCADVSQYLRHSGAQSHRGGAVATGTGRLPAQNL